MAVMLRNQQRAGAFRPLPFIGAQAGKKLRIDNADAENVESAVEMLDRIGNGEIPDYTGQTVVVIGGGTVAMFMAERNINTIDAGVPVLSMHAPFEVVSKLDCYMTYKGIKTLFNR